jgi:L-asparagine permease
VLVLVGFDYPVGTWTVGSIAVIIPLLILGWFLCRKRITAIAQERAGFTGQFPVIANRPLADQNRRNPRRVDGVDSDPLD